VLQITAAGQFQLKTSFNTGTQLFKKPVFSSLLPAPLPPQNPPNKQNPSFPSIPPPPPASTKNKTKQNKAKQETKKTNKQTNKQTDRKKLVKSPPKLPALASESDR